MADTTGARILLLVQELRQDLERARVEGSRRGDTLELLRLRVDGIEGAVLRLAELDEIREKRAEQELTEITERRRWMRSLVSRDVLVPVVTAALSVVAVQFPIARSLLAVFNAVTGHAPPP